MSRQIPKGVEVLVHKAAVDPVFRADLLARRAAAAEDIGLPLEATEAAMLAAVPAAQLETIIARTSVPEEHRRAFLGKAAAAMLAAVGAMSGGVAAAGIGIGGIRPQDPPGGGTFGIQPDVPKPTRVKPNVPPPKEIAERVAGVVRTALKLAAEEVVGRETSLVKDLKADTAGLSAVRDGIDREFSLKLPADALKKTTTVGQLTDRVEKALKNRKPEKPEKPPPKLPPDRIPIGGIRPNG
jgi:acyl carrier protein